MDSRSISDKDELILTQRVPRGFLTSTARSQRLRINLVDTQSSLSSPTYSPLPSPLKLYADWSQSLAPGISRSGDAPTDAGEGNAKATTIPKTMSERDQEYDSLPPALRRKYFSTLERLRLAQRSASSRSKHGPLSGTYSVSISAGKTYVGKDRRPATLVRPSSRRLQKQDSRSSRYLASQVDAEWFSSLPPKIQRKHFTQEEQDRLTRNRDDVILDAADEKLYRLGQHANQTTTSVLPKSDANSKQAIKINTRPMEGHQRSADVDMKDLMGDSFRWLDDEDDIDLTLDDYRPQTTHEAKPSLDISNTPRSRPSFRRTFSLSSITFGRNSGSSQRLSESEFPRRTSFSFAPSATKPIIPITHSPGSTSRPQTQQRFDAIDPSAKHYQDPDARRKLRVYLASPQKFDEAVEFGFPSLKAGHKDQPKVTLEASKNTSVSNEISSRSFLDDDVVSFPGGEPPGADHDDASVAESDSPKTPDDSHQRDNEIDPSPSKKFPTVSPDSTNTPRPRLVGMRTEPYATEPMANREMTLHMTLTRPDLRTTSTDVFAPNKMPLKLSELPLADEAATVWDTLPVETGKMKKIWQRLTRK
ncbi:MAG: hypothetical protein Q9160_004528 [Pyrenula sp. 1 TL-2023]